MRDNRAGPGVDEVDPAAATTVITVDRDATIVMTTPAFDSLIGSDSATVAGSSLTDLLAPGEPGVLDTLLGRRTDDHGRSEPEEPAPVEGTTATVLGRRHDGLPLVLELGVGPATGDPGHRLLIAGRGGGPVGWADDPQPPTPARTGPDHVLSHDARASVRNARNFIGLFARKLPDAGVDPETLPPSFLDTGLRALATGDEILDRIVWYLRLEHDPIAMRDLPLALIVEMARRQSDADAEDRAAATPPPDPDRDEPSATPPVVLTVSLDDDRAAIVGNHELLAWVFAELFTNARKFAGRDAVHVSVGVTVDGPWTRITVHDPGAGIVAELSEDAFQLGRMLQPRGQRPGVGLGLPLSRRIVTRHGGRLRFDLTDRLSGATGTTLVLSLLTSGDPDGVG